MELLGRAFSCYNKEERELDKKVTADMNFAARELETIRFWK